MSQINPEYVDGLELRIQELKRKLREKAAYHCPKCDDWFGEDELHKTQQLLWKEYKRNLLILLGKYDNAMDR